MTELTMYSIHYDSRRINRALSVPTCINSSGTQYFFTVDKRIYPPYLPSSELQIHPLQNPYLVLIIPRPPKPNNAAIRN